jgi:hypothetical protein
LNGGSNKSEETSSSFALTTDDTPTLLRAIALETGATKTVSGTITATDGDDGTANFSFAIKNQAGTNSSVGTPILLMDSDSGFLSLSLNHVGATTQILVTGIAATNITWDYIERLF